MRYCLILALMLFAAPAVAASPAPKEASQFLDKTLVTYPRQVQAYTLKSDAYDPEQLLAASYAACFHGALTLLAARSNIALVDNVVDATVTFARDPVDGRFLLRAEIRVSLPGIDRRIAAELVRNTERICPYAKMFRQGIEHVVALAPDETSPDPLRNP